MDEQTAMNPFREIIDQNPMAMAIVGMDGTIEYINRRAVETFGYELAAIPDMEHWWKLAYPDEAYRREVIGRWTGLVEKAIAERAEIEKNEYRITCRNKAVKVVVVYGIISTDKVFVMFEDITERKQTEEALQKSLENYQSLAATVDSLFLVDRNYAVTFANDNFIGRIKSYHAGPIIGESIDAIFHESQINDLHEGLDMAFSTGKPHSDGVWGYYTKRYLVRTFSPVRDDRGNVTAVTVASKDMTQHKLAEERIQASMREKDLLLREIHHRVKNNMQVVSSLLALQASSSDNPEIVAMCGKSQKRIQSMALIHEKLYRSGDFTKIELGDYAADLVKGLLHAYTANPANIELVIEAKDVYTDINQAIPCGLILNELIVNALKHAFPGDRSGKLQIEIRKTKKSIVMVVRDNGVGLPNDIDIRQPRGIGLYLVNGLVKNQLGGRIEIIRDGGTAFRIRFPLPADSESCLATK